MAVKSSIYILQQRVARAERKQSRLAAENDRLRHALTISEANNILIREPPFLWGWMGHNNSNKTFLEK